MDQNEHILQFNRQLDRLLSGKALDMSLPPSDQRALELARRLLLANFSTESHIQDEIYLKTIKSNTIEAKLPNVRLPRFNFSTWARTALVFMVLLVHSIEILDPMPAFTATNLPAHVVMAVPSPSVTTSSWMTNTQAIKPVPIPTPLAISAIANAQNQPFLASNSSIRSSFVTPDRTQTPKPDLLPRSDSRP